MSGGDGKIYNLKRPTGWTDADRRIIARNKLDNTVIQFLGVGYDEHGRAWSVSVVNSVSFPDLGFYDYPLPGSESPLQRAAPNYQVTATAAEVIARCSGIYYEDGPGWAPSGPGNRLESSHARQHIALIRFRRLPNEDI